jgi:hypothetical protein
VYTIQVNQFPFPTKRNGTWKLALSSVSVHMFNENYLHLDVHALRMDLFVPSAHSNRLHHIGNIQDGNTGGLGGLPNSNNREQIVLPPSQQQQPQSPPPPSVPLWSVPPRSNFTANDTTLYIGTQFMPLLQSLTQVLRQIWSGGFQTITLPTTGVVHIIATTPGRKKRRRRKTVSDGNNHNHTISDSSSSSRMLKAPLTVSIICDNVIHLWTLQVTGVQCTMFGMVPGFHNLIAAANTVRDHALHRMWVYNDTLLQQNNTGMTMEEMLVTIGWEESMQMLS